MTAATRRTISSSLAGLDPEARLAAADAAHRAGMSVEEWVAEAIIERSAPPARSERLRAAYEPERAPRPASRTTRAPAASAEDLEAALARLARAQARTNLDHGYDEGLGDGRRSEERLARTASALDSMSRLIERADERINEEARRTAERQKQLNEEARLTAERLSEETRRAAERQERTAAIMSNALGLITQRLEGIERNVVETHKANSAAALKAVERLEAQLEQDAKARALEHDSRVDTMLRDFEGRIAEIGQRLSSRIPEQRAPAPAPIPAASDPIGKAIAQIRARQAELGGGATLAVAPEPTAPVRPSEELLNSLRSDIARLAEMQSARSEPDLDRLGEEVADNIHSRLAAELDKLRNREDGKGEQALTRLAAEVEHLRRGMDGRDNTPQLRALSEQLAALDRRVEQADSNDIDTVRAGIDEIRAAVERIAADGGGRTASELTARLAVLDRKIDLITERGAQPDFDALSRQIDSIANRLAAAPQPRGSELEDRMEAIAQRLERLDENVRQPPAAPDLAPIEDMLRNLADKLDRVERHEGGDGSLDALERQVAALAQRLDHGTLRDPAIAGLERVMGDLMTQVETLREEAYDTAERAARNAVNDGLARTPAAMPELGGLGRDLAELKAYQSAAERRTQSTLENVHAALEKVVSRLAAIDQPGIRADAGRAESGRAGSTRPMTATRAERGAAAPALDEVLLEPGAARPRFAVPPLPKPEGEIPDVKASFIAAARRAAQAATEAATQAPSAPQIGEQLRPASGAASAPGLAGRMKSALSARRRPILLGLGAVVLALLTLQAVSTFRSAAPNAPAIESSSRAPAPTAPIEPKTTQSLALPAPAVPSRSLEAAQAEAREDEALAEAQRLAKPEARAAAPAAMAALPLTGSPATPSAERIAGITAGDLPANLGPAGLRQAALAGDPSALYEVAARAADGRGTPRDVKLAAKLFERLAATGLAPAQYRLGSHYEKGLGVTRDIAVARGWYERAARAGNSRAMHNLAVLIAEGGNGKPDYAGAVEWFRQAAEFGVRDSQYNLAVLLARGMGASQDLQASYRWFALAAAQGDDDAGKKRDEIGAKLGAADLAAAKGAIDRWKPRIGERAANEVVGPPQGWGEAARSVGEKRV